MGRSGSYVSGETWRTELQYRQLLGRTTKERWVSDNMRKTIKEKFKKDEDVEKNLLIVKDSHLFTIHF